MDEQALRDALRAAPAPDEAAARVRARRVVHAAHVSTPQRARPRRGATVAVVLAVFVALVGTAVAGSSAVSRWVGHALHVTPTSTRRPARSELSRLPGGGRVLVSTSRGNTWIVGDRSPRRVRATAAVLGWSAYGHYLVAAQQDSLEALDLSGRVLWREGFGAVVSDAVWSPDGNRIAFAVGRQLWVTAADGSAPRRLPVGDSRGPAMVVAPAWRPGPARTLAIAGDHGQVVIVDADSGRSRVGLRIGGRPVALGWSADGRRLLVATAGGVRVFDASSRLIRAWHAPVGTRVSEARLSPRAAQFAVLLALPNQQSAAALVPLDARARARTLLSTGAIGDLFYSPDGRWLLLAWHSTDSWLFFATGQGERGVVQIARVARQLDNAEPVVTGWCCTR